MNTDFAGCTKGSYDHLLLWALDRLDEALQENRIEAVKSYARAVECLVSQRAGSPEAVIVGYRAEGDEPCSSSKRLLAA